MHSIFLRRASIFWCVAFAFTSLVVTTCVSRAAEQIRIGYQKSSTLISILKANGELERALTPLGVYVSWHEFSSGLPLLEAVNVGSIDVSGDVADTVPVFAQAAGARIAYYAEETASPSAQAVLVDGTSTIKTVADLKGKRVAVTKGAGSHYLLLAALSKSGLNFQDITPAYLAPADGRAAFASHSVDAWVAWDPYLTTAKAGLNARTLIDGSNGLASYKRYYLSTIDFADRHRDILNVIFSKLTQTGKWVKAHPKDAASILGALWKIEEPLVVEAISHRSYQVQAVTPAELSEQQKIADAFTAEKLLPRTINTSDVKIWSPGGS
jgi:sulfonate transport system substrate-binding protein